jgi:hypothetical protein
VPADFVCKSAGDFVPHCAMVSIRFAPPGTDTTRLRTEYPLSDAERAALTPDVLRTFSQDQVDQIYSRLWAGPIPDGPFRGDLFLPRDRHGFSHVRDLPDPAPRLFAKVGTLPVEQLGRALWKGKVFFRSQGVVRNRIEDAAILKALLPDSGTIPKLTFDGQTTWLLFPAAASCGDSRFDPTRRSIVIDYAKGPQIEGYRSVPDDLAGPSGLNVRDEIRRVRAGFYLGRAYFGQRFALNFTLLDPASEGKTLPPGELEQDCDGAAQERR